MRDPREKLETLNVLQQVSGRFGVQRIGHVILDDHLHFLLRGSSADIPRWVSAFKQRINFDRRNAGLAWAGLWQKRYYEHVIRGDADFRRHLDYIHYNPVKHGYVDSAQDYPWSSFRHWVGRGAYETDWGTSVLPDAADLDLE
ncbi:MAG: REP-associated tyrosine transposase [Candidatus Wenzhouxiangella sp. M2_3B_020]